MRGRPHQGDRGVSCEVGSRPATQVGNEQCVVYQRGGDGHNVRPRVVPDSHEVGKAVPRQGFPPAAVSPRCSSPHRTRATIRGHGARCTPRHPQSQCWQGGGAPAAGRLAAVRIAPITQITWRPTSQRIRLNKALTCRCTRAGASAARAQRCVSRSSTARYKKISFLSGVTTWQIPATSTRNTGVGGPAGCTPS